MGIRAHTTSDFSSTHLLCLQMAFNTFLQCLVFGVLIMAVSQVDGTNKQTAREEVHKCNMDCVVKHIPSVTSVANVNDYSMSQCSLQSACANCMKDCATAAIAAAKAGAGGVAVTSFTFLLSLAIGLFAM